MSGRGRGKRAAVKNITVGAVDANTVIASPVETVETVDTVETVQKPVKKTNKKKQFPVVAIITPDGIEGNLTPEVRRPLIVHLPIQSKDVIMNDMPIAYNPNIVDVQPYDSNADNPFYDDVELLPVPPSNQVVIPHNPVELQQNENNQTEIKSSASTNIVPDIDFYNLKGTLLVQYKDSAEVKKIPESSDIACFWCCHTFTNRPVVLPIRDTGEHLIVHGNFCCPECACAYLFDIRQDSHTRWEQLALLYRVYGDACDGKIHPAPYRAVLRHFGGNLSIQDYRSLIRSHKVRVDIHLPPMVSILSTMDTKPIDFYDASLTKNVTETVKERLQKAEEVLRLRRTKPLKAWESTLDACINLKIKHETGTIIGANA